MSLAAAPAGPQRGASRGALSQPRRGPGATVSVLVIAVVAAILIGLAAVALPPGFVGVLAAAVLLPATAALWLNGRAVHSRDWMLALLLAGLLVIPMLIRITGANFGTPWQAVILLLSLFGLRAFLAQAKGSGWLRLALVCFSLYLVVSIAATMLGRSQPTAAVFQFVSNLKPLLLVALGFALAWDERCERLLWAVIAWAWLPMVAMVVFEWGAPGAFQQYTYPGLGALSRDPTGLFPSRAVSLFEHPSLLAATAACFAVLVAARIASLRAGRVRWAFVLLLYVGLVVASVQRQELAALLLALGVVLAARDKKHGLRNIVFAVSVLAVGAIAIWFTFGVNIERESRLWGVGSLGAIEHPRSQIFQGGVQLATDYFPLGSGLGTYAGAGAEKFDLSLYQDLGFGRYWWFGRRDYLLDTYWPNSLGETGLFGFLLLAIFFFALLAYIVQSWWRNTVSAAGPYWLAAVALMVYMLAISLTSPAFQDPRLFAIPALLIGVAGHLGRKSG